MAKNKWRNHLEVKLRSLKKYEWALAQAFEIVQRVYPVMNQTRKPELDLFPIVFQKRLFWLMWNYQLLEWIGKKVAVKNSYHQSVLEELNLAGEKDQ